MRTAGGKIGVIHTMQQFPDLPVFERMCTADDRMAGNTGKQTFQCIIEGGAGAEPLQFSQNIPDQNDRILLGNQAGNR